MNVSCYYLKRIFFAFNATSFNKKFATYTLRQWADPKTINKAYVVIKQRNINPIISHVKQFEKRRLGISIAGEVSPAGIVHCVQRRQFL